MYTKTTSGNDTNKSCDVTSFTVVIVTHWFLDPADSVKINTYECT